MRPGRHAVSRPLPRKHAEAFLYRYHGTRRKRGRWSTSASYRARRCRCEITGSGNAPPELPTLRTASAALVRCRGVTAVAAGCRRACRQCAASIRGLAYR